jgi:hypothetical protein
MTRIPISREAMAPLERLLTTRRFLPTVVILITLPIIAFTLVVAFTSVSLNQANLYVDSAVKIIATLAAAAWALNRYFTNRIDEPQLRIDPQIDVAAADASKPSSSNGLLLCRLEIVNTGQVLFNNYTYTVQIDSVKLQSDGTVAYKPIKGYYERNGKEIEPGSWAAYSQAMALEQHARAIVVSLEISLKATNEIYYSWHKLFKVPTGNGKDSSS